MGDGMEEEKKRSNGGGGMEGGGRGGGGWRGVRGSHPPTLFLLSNVH